MTRVDVPVYNKKGGVLIGTAILRNYGPAGQVIIVLDEIYVDELIQLHQFGLAEGLTLNIVTQEAQTRRESVSTLPIPTEERTRKAIRLVYEYVKERLEKTDNHVEFSPEGVYIVWLCSILGNWKAMVSTILPDGMYYEVTYNGDKGETYIDAYKKWDNVCIQDRVEPEQMKG